MSEGISNVDDQYPTEDGFDPDSTIASRPGLRKTHARSVSHGGVLIPREYGPAAGSDTVAYSRGHQRALSQGQADKENGHKREGSRTDFVLPHDHEERLREREQRNAKKSTFRPTAVGSYKKGHNRKSSRSDSLYSIRNQKVPWIRKIFFNRKKQDDKSPRFIYPNHIPSKIHDNAIYPTNRICTRKYTILSFLPKNLFEQFHRIANLYFLFIVLLNFVPSINAFAKELAVTPLLFVLGVTAIKDAFEDHRRYISDKLVNNTFCRVYCSLSDRYVKRYWKDVRVGDIVHLSCEELIPADIVLLNSSDDNGICYIESSNLDGEITLKQRHCVKGLHYSNDQLEACKFDGQLEIGPPTTKIYHFVGSMRLRSGEKLPLTKENLILRACVLKNTDFVEGIVVYAGPETKAMLNNGGPRYKRSRLERRMNKEVGICVLILIVICLVSATGAGFWESKYAEIKDVPFLPPDEIEMLQTTSVEETPLWVAFTSFWSFIIIYQVLIPISLYVTIEIIKLMQIYHIQCDENFLDEKSGTTIKCRALNIPEELGQVEYVFADKTGTLTENDMVFRRCSVNFQDYEHKPPNVSLPQDQASRTVVPNPGLLEKLHAIEFKHVFDEDGNPSVTMAEDCQRLHDFFFVLAACNTVVVSKRAHRDTMTASGAIMTQDDVSEVEHLTPTRSIIENFHPRLRTLLTISPRMSLISPPANTPSDTPRESPKNSSNFNVHQVTYTATENSPGQDNIVLRGFKPISPAVSDNTQRPDDLRINTIEEILTTPEPRPLTAKPYYESESPDELALVQAAYSYGVQLLRRNLSSVLVAMPGTGNLEYEILHILPFDSNRKRMSIVVKDPETNEIILYCKGADSAIIDNLRRATSFEEHRRVEDLKRYLGSYARIGLRVLCMSKRVLLEEVYNLWSEKLLEAENAVTANRDKVLENIYSEIEVQLELLGATGIEDKLQDGVPETIDALRKAGITVCVLTGDKQETAINIAYSCSLFNTDMKILMLCASTKRETEGVLNRFLFQVENEDGVKNVPLDAANSGPIKRKRGLVVDGRTLVYILDRSANLRNAFLSLAKRCTAILCCRATPLQKALVVRLTKNKLKALCLAVGDGANDVPMIQTADVGVGISGVEGRQAVMASDYAISRFRHLERLLLVHGHWCYERLAKTVLYFFYKNCSFVFLLLFYQLYCGYSGSLMIEQVYLIAFNLFFTSLPPLAIGIYNQDAPESLLLGLPHLYSQGRLGFGYGSHSFIVNMIDSFYQAAVIFFFNALAYDHADTGIYEFGIAISHTCLVVQLLHIAIETNSWNVLSIGSLVVSYLTFIVFSVLYTVACNGCTGLPSMVGEFTHVFFSGPHWLILLIATVVALIPRYTVRALLVALKPSDVTTALLLENSKKKQSGGSPSSHICRVICNSPTEEANDAMNSLVTMTSLVPIDDSDA